MRSKAILVSVLLLVCVLQLAPGPAASAASRGVWNWGSNAGGALGVATTTDVPSPINGPKVDSAFVRISAGNGSSTYGITADGTAWSWGDNFFGQLGDGTTTASSVPVRISVPVGVRFTRVSAGAGHALAIDAAGHAWAWGWNVLGQLGDGTTTERTHPVRVHFPSDVTVSSVSAGYDHSMALDSRGRVWEWGSLDGVEHLQPVRTSGWPASTPDVVSISAGAGYDLALSAVGRVYAWGTNDVGDLGDGTMDSSPTPVRVHFPRTVEVRSISAGPYDGYAIDEAGGSWAWGEGGWIGDGSFSHTTLPVRISVPAGTTFASIARGSVALATDGSVWVWGDNESGRLGEGTFDDDTAIVPRRVDLPPGVTVDRISAGGDSVFALGSGAPEADLFVSHRGDLSSSPYGGTEYLEVGNDGAPSSNVTLTYTMPPNTIFGSADPSQGTCNATSTKVICALGHIRAAAEVAVRMQPLSIGTYSTSGSISVGDATPQDNSFTAAYSVSELNNAWRYVDDTDDGFQRPSLQVLPDDFLDINIVGSSPNGVRDASGLDLFESGTLSPPDYFVERFVYSGTYAIVDELGHDLTVKVPISVKPDVGTTASSFIVRWNGAPPGDVADVQVAYCADPSCTPGYRSWRRATIDGVATFSSADPFWKGSGTYFFRSRIREKGTRTASDWSPPHPVTVSA